MGWCGDFLLFLTLTGFPFNPIAHGDEYPSYVPFYHQRKDSFSHNPVVTGRFELFDGFPDKPSMKPNFPKISRQKFRELLQCVPHEHQLTEIGSLNFMKIIPPTKEIVENIAMWCETECQPWSRCQQLKEDYKNGNYPNSVDKMPRMSNGSPYQIKLLRLLNGKLYLDWPWGRDRIRLPYGSITNPLLYLTQVISDLPDIFFFIGLERSWTPAHFPVPSFSNSPSFMTSDLPFPWYVPMTIQIETYREILQKKNQNFTEESVLASSQFGQEIPWDLKINKCAYYGALTENRQIFFHHALTRPDLIDIGWTMDYLGTFDWNPLSQNPHRMNSDTVKEFQNSSSSKDQIGAGYNSNLLPKQLKHGVNFVKKYKYLVVLTGLNGEALSGSLNNLLTQSGAVILLQRSPFLYHYSSHLKPWVHYVPLSFHGDDIIEKIEWLQSHPHMARRIAENGRRFGQSYLRLEDYFCYFVNIFESIAQRVNQTDSLEPFDPVEITVEFDRW
jgi:hypothetical protein